jgi:hypothetical protein
MHHPLANRIYMTASEIIEILQKRFDGVVIKAAYAETTLFYNPKKVLPNGVYFLTIKENDGPNDKASRLHREGVFRVSFKPKPSTYKKMFGEKPKRAKAGRISPVQSDQSRVDQWMPHAIYAWMGWTMILSPSKKSFDHLWPYIQESYDQAKEKFEQRVKPGSFTRSSHS